MLAAFLASLATTLAPYDFYAQGPYDSAVPHPEKTLGYRIGERHTVFRDQERVVLGITERAKRTTRVFEYGKSYEGRPLRVVAISSPANLDRLDAIRADIQRLARGEGDAAAIAKRTPVIVWINQCIHGDETASFESAMPLLYNLAASQSPRIKKMLENAVVVLNPVYNPDGHERYVVWYNSIAVGSPFPEAYEQRPTTANRGRHNHYRFDMNRDRISILQAETVQEVREFLKWHPQVYADQHGQTDNYFFPPVALATNENVDRVRYNEWSDVFGRATAKAFDAQGWMYFTKDTYDFFAAAFLDTWTTLSGAIGMTHETDGGRTLAVSRADGTILTMREGAEKHFVSALAVIESAASRRESLLLSFAKHRKASADGSHSPTLKRVVVSGSVDELARLEDQLSRHGIVSRYLAEDSRQTDAHDYWGSGKGEAVFPKNSLVIDLAQPQGRLAKALLEPDAKFDEEFLKKQAERQKAEKEGEEEPFDLDYDGFYDITAWSLPYAHNLRAWWTESAPALKTGPRPEKPMVKVGKSSIGYVIPYRDETDALAAAEILRAGVKGLLLTREMRVSGQEFARGAFLFMAGRNEPDFHDKLFLAARKRGVTPVPLESAYPDEGKRQPGSEQNVPLRKPEIAVVFGRPGDLGSVSGIWFLLEQIWKLPFTPITVNALSGDLSRFSCILVPEGAGATVTPKLREWVQGGGSLVALGGASWALGSTGFATFESSNAEFSLTGSFYRASLDGRSFLGYGYPLTDGRAEIAVPVSGRSFWKGRNAAVQVDADPKTARLSGWSWEGDSDKAIAGSVWANAVSVGGGSVTLFAEDPTERVRMPGLWKMVLNAILLGSRP